MLSVRLMNRKSGRLSDMRRLMMVWVCSMSGSRRSQDRGIAFASCSDSMAEEQLEFGAELARAREQHGITLSELARRTKIGVDALKAIERCDVTALPGGLYTRGFLRAYAREVGLNPDDIVRRYREKFKDQDQVANAMAQLEVGVNVTCAPGQVHVKDIDAMTRRWSRTAWLSGGAVVLLGAAIHFALTPTTSWKTARNQTVSSAPKPGVTSTAPPAPGQPSGPIASPPTTAPNTAATTASSIGTSGSSTGAPPSGPTDAPTNTLRLDVKPNGDCWLSAIADGQRVLYRLMAAGEHAQIEAHDELTLLVGDPATCVFDINGAGVRQLGAPGQPVTVHLTRQNFEQYLERPAADRRPVTLPQ
jgi:cytoskeleton protein RodZ